MTPSVFRRHCLEHGADTGVSTSHYTLPQKWRYDYKTHTVKDQPSPIVNYVHFVA